MNNIIKKWSAPEQHAQYWRATITKYYEWCAHFFHDACLKIYLYQFVAKLPNENKITLDLDRQLV